MTILDYDEDRKVLAVKFNTSTVWKYNNICKTDYERIKNSVDPENDIRGMLHKSFIVGTSKKEITL